ncbi:MAG TPA: protoglobin domain-containing protein [Candidatus Udaeobacter sp.]|nr:protoglobin domain-containing protein [Candidatus Udaeobacter sp.]
MSETKLPDYGVPPESFTSELWEECKRYLEFDGADIGRLKAILPRYSGLIATLVDSFYDHLLSFQNTKTVLAREDVAGRLKAAQRQYLRTLAEGEYGEAYLRDRIRIGLVHERIGLAPRWYLGAYWIYIRELLPLVLPRTPPAERAEVLSLLKIILLDMMLVTESYVGRTLALVTEQNQRLEETVAERTRQLTKWERLAAVGSMAAKAAHEIRNPLSSISLNTELLSDELLKFEGCDTREAGELLDSIQGELDRLRRLLEEYMSFARMPLTNLEPVDLREFADRIARFIAPELERRGIDIEVVGGASSQLYLDRDQFRQAILNLLRNSQEAMPGGGKITIRIDEDADGTVELVVIDSGVGIDPANLDRVFDPFYSTKDMGTGLGLALVQQVMTEHGGRAICTSQPERGAAFRLVFPESLRVRPGQ